MVIAVIGFYALRPSFVGSLRTAQERTALRHLTGLLKGARTEAIGQGKLVRIMWDRQEGAFWAEAQVDPMMDRSQFAPLAVLGRSAVTLPEWLAVRDFAVGGRTAGGLLDTALYCYPDGRTDGAKITLVRSSGKPVRITMAATTGSVHLNE